MKRLVYSPSINAWIKTDHGVVDISSYITECTVNRKIDEVSRAIISFRNPKINDGRFMFTEHESNGVVGPMFHPMDPIIITMTRIKGKPIQVFTGYCDTTAYVQLFPGIATIEASCTLKRLLHTYWDPGLSFVMDFMQQYGWSYDNVSGTSIMPNPAANDTPKLNDTGIGNLLGAMLNEVGGWEKDDILIQPLPSQAIEKQVGKIFDQLVQSGKDATQQYVDYIAEYINAASAIGGPTAASGNLNADSPTTGNNAGITGQGLPANVGSFEGTPVAEWIIPILQWARQHGWTGTVTDGWRPQNATYGSATSNHKKSAYPGGAIDVGGPNDAAAGAAFANAIKDYQKHNPGKPTLIQGVNTPWGGYPHDLGHFSATGH